MNLASRLIERDPLRSVMLPSDEIAAFIKKGKEAYDEVERAVSRYVPGEPKYFYKIEELVYPLLEEEHSSNALLVHTEELSRKTTRLYEHPIIRGMHPTFRVTLGWKLLVPREARDDVSKLVRRGA